MTASKAWIPSRQADPVVRARRLAYLIFERPDLGQAEDFLTAFGLEVAERDDSALFFRGAIEAPFCYVVRRGSEARFVGFALEVDGLSDLERLSALPGASPVETLATPGGGQAVRLRDPSGFVVEAVHGQACYPARPARAPHQANCGPSTPRVNAGVRIPAVPPAVLKLGHIVLEVVDYRAASEWYTKNFGLIPSDVQTLPDGSPAVAFFRLDLGSTPADHHTLAMGQSVVPGFSHAAFEVVDLDDIGMGQRVLRESGYRHAWGIGRHVLGSQVFDYWNDPWDDKHEHYCDGDVFTSDSATEVSAASPEGLSAWSPVLPASFLRPKGGPGLLVAALRNVVRSPDLSLGKLRLMLRMAASTKAGARSKETRP